MCQTNSPVKTKEHTSWTIGNVVKFKGGNNLYTITRVDGDKIWITDDLSENAFEWAGSFERVTTRKVFRLVETDEDYWNEVERNQSAGNDAYDEVHLVRAHSKDEIVDVMNSHEALLEAAKALLALDEIKNCPNGRWSTADPINYSRVVALEQAIAQAEK